MLGTVPFTILIPYLDGFLSYVNVFVVGFLSLSSFAVTVVYAQQLVPGKIRLAAGLMLGLGIGAGGLEAMLLGVFADIMGITFVMHLLVVFPIVSFLLSLSLPNDHKLATA